VEQKKRKEEMKKKVQGPVAQVQQQQQLLLLLLLARARARHQTPQGFANLLTYVVVAPDFGCLSGVVRSGAGCSDRFVTKHEVEYERRQFGDQVHHRLTKGWYALSLNLGASVGDTLEMSRYRDGESEGIKGGAINDGSAAACFFQEKAPPRHSFAL
jgi:hypothetical protein